MNLSPWLTLAEAARYLRIPEQVLREELEHGPAPIPHSSFCGEQLFHKMQLDRFLFGLQNPVPRMTPPVHPIPTDEETQDSLGASHLDARRGTPGETRHRPEAPPTGDFMADALKLWDDGHLCIVKLGTRGASCQFNGKPRLWIYPDKFQIPAKEKGNDLYTETRQALSGYFPHITSKATVHINSPSFSWATFVAFVEQLKNICREHNAQSSSTGSSKIQPASHDDGEADSTYGRCITRWEQPPEFTIVYGTRGCSAKHKNRPRLWFFPDSLRIPAETQGNELFDSIRRLKERLLPDKGTRTVVRFDEPSITSDQITAFVTEVKKLVTEAIG